MDRSDAIGIFVVFGGVLLVIVAVFVFHQWEQRKK